ncbi:MAG TPA: trypsin-like serine protease [Solirubrobacterales bacterium]
MKLSALAASLAVTALLAPLAADAATRVEPRLPLLRYRPQPVAGASSLKVADVTALGTRTNGRIFATDANGTPYTCSGTSLNRPSGSIVLTAGHCVVEDGVWGKSLSFVPAFDHDRRPFGTFTAIATYVMPQWQHSQNDDFDVAALKVAPNRLGRLADVVGARGFITGHSRFSPFQIFGYPAAALEGQELRSCLAQGLGSDLLTNLLPGPPTLPAACNMAGGASGGAWLLGDKYIAGVTSYSYPATRNRLFSPYFGPTVGAFLRSLP